MNIKAQWLGFLFSLALVLFLSAQCFVSDANAAAWPSGSDFLVGVAGQVSYREATWWSGYGGSDADIERQIHLVAEMGSKIYRLNAQSYTEDIIEKVITLCEKYGIAVMLIVDINSGAGVVAGSFKGRVKYYQVNNEMDGKCIDWWNNGTEISHFKMSTDIPRPPDDQCLDLWITRAIKGIKAVRAEDPGAKVLINGTWTHYGFLEYAFKRFKEESVDIDLIGWDWYSNDEKNRGGVHVGDGFNSVAKHIYNTYKKDIIICEYNRWIKDFDEVSVGGSQYVPHLPGNGNKKIDLFEEDNMDTLMGPYLVNNIQYLYNNRAENHIKGLIIYELIEEPGLLLTSGQDDWAEAKFGITYAKMLTPNDPYARNYQILGPKKAYYDVQQLLGGGSVPIQRLNPPATLPEYTITASVIDVSPSGTILSSQAGGTVTGGDVYKENSVVTLTATANPGCEFLGWYRGGIRISKNTAYTFTAYENANNTVRDSSDGKFAYEARYEFSGGAHEGAITAITPAEARRGTNNVSVTINGTNLLAGSTAKLVNGSNTITANTVTYDSSNKLIAAFNIPSAATVGNYNLILSSSGYVSDVTKNAIFLVLGDSMSISSVTPAAGIKGTTLNVSVTGTDIKSGATIKLVNGSTVINGTAVTQNGTTEITASFALPASIANETKFDLTVRNMSGDYVTKPQAVTVYDALTVTNFTPLSANAGSAVNLTVNGTGFITGQSKVILKNAANESITITPNVTSLSATQIAATFTAPSSAGTWKVYVSAYNGGSEYAAASNMTISNSTTYNLFAYEGAIIEFPVISRDSAQNTGMMIVSERTFSEDVAIDVKQHGSLAPADSYVRELSHTNIGVIIDAQGKKPEREIELRIPYNNSDITGMNEDSLVISRYDEERQVWVPLKSKADNVKKQIIAYLDHLSIFAIMGTASAVKAFEDVKYYPNPLQPSKGLNYSKMNFSNMPAGTRIKIYTMLGQVVRELRADASGMAVWDGKNNAGEKAASGVYIVYMEDGNGNKKRIKVAVER